MTSRRSMLIAGAAGSLAAVAGTASRATGARDASALRLTRPCVVSTWDFGVAANRAAWQVLAGGGRALDAVEAGARIPEDDLNNHSVGRAGYPDRDGKVTLDASIMDGQGNCGAVAGMEHIAHPISVARRVMERTPHVLLVGDGALQFALEQGFPREELLTPESKAAWEARTEESGYTPVANSEVRSYGAGASVPGSGVPGGVRGANLPGTPGVSGIPGDKHDHDTIGMLAIDVHGHISGGCTTSGMAWKLHGRVGDSPIIGAGLFVDDAVGGATSTGVGEEVIRNVGSFLVVELMRQGRSPEQACRAAVERILERKPNAGTDLQVGFLAIDKHGRVGAWSIQPGFRYAACDAARQDRLVDVRSSRSGAGG